MRVLGKWGGRGSPVRILVVHTNYRQRGGEDAVVAMEQRLLESAGHEVSSLRFDNSAFARRSRLDTAVGTVWNRGAAHRVREAVREQAPEVVHVHNTFPAASPAVFRSAAPVGLVHTVHNFRWSCLAATFHREGRPCEACLGRLPWPGVWYGCYNGDRAASAVVATMLTLHRTVGTLDAVDRFVALSEFARQKLITAGVPGDRVVVKPNFVEPGPPPPALERRSHPPFALFVGRLVEEKGVKLLARVWRHGTDLPRLVVAGDGPLRGTLEKIPRVTCLGSVESEEVTRLMRRARILMFPSTWYEGFPLVLLEAFAAGLPVVASDLGVMREMVVPGRTGWRVPVDDAAAWTRAVRCACDAPSWPELSARARQEAERRYGPERAAARLVEVYDEARKHAARRAKR